MSETEGKLDELAWRSLVDPATACPADLGLTPSEILETCEVSEGKLAFRDRREGEARAIRHIKDRIIRPVIHTPAALFDALRQCWLHSGQARDAMLGDQALAQLHNANEVDVLHLAIAAVQGGSDAFAVSRAMSASLPLLDHIDVPNLLILVGLVSQRGSLEYAVGERMTSDPSVVADVVGGCLANPSEALGGILRAGLILEAKRDRDRWLPRIQELTAGQDELVAVPAIEALGLLDWIEADVEEVDSAVAIVRDGLLSERPRTRVASVLAGLNLVRTSVDRHELIDEIAALDESYIVQQIGNHLAFIATQLKTQTWFMDKVDLLATKPGQATGSYHGIDNILTERYGASDREKCLVWVKKWVATYADESPSLSGEFPQLFRTLEHDAEALGQLLAEWLTDESIAMQKMARNLLDELGLDERNYLAFPVSALNALSTAGLLHLVRRTLANVIRDTQRISLIWSLTLVDSGREISFAIVRDAMVSFVGYDYPLATKEYLEAVVAGDALPDVVQLAQEILDAMKAYYDALGALPMIEELQPPSEQVYRFAKEQNRKMNSAFDEASKNSLLSHISTRIPLKAGRSMFTVRNGNVGEKAYMTSASHSVAVPRSETTDKVGSDLQRRLSMLSTQEPDGQ